MFACCILLGAASARFGSVWTIALVLTLEMLGGLSAIFASLMTAQTLAQIYLLTTASYGLGIMLMICAPFVGRLRAGLLQ